MLLTMLRQFGYPSLAAARAETAEIVRFMEIERLGSPEPEGGDDPLG